MLPVIEAFMAAHQLTDATVVAGASLVSESSRKHVVPRIDRELQFGLWNGTRRGARGLR
jgi:hypothetical protein